MHWCFLYRRCSSAAKLDSNMEEIEGETRNDLTRKSDSESDEGGYVTPGEVADDERPPTPQKEESVDVGQCLYSV